MADNYFIKFAGTSIDNIITDSEFYTVVTFTSKGIERGSEAFSDVLNGILKQATTVSSVLAAYIQSMETSGLFIDTSNFNVSRLTAAIDKQITDKNYATLTDMPFVKNNWASGSPTQYGVWVGTESQYNAIATKLNTVLYFIVED